MLVHHLCCLTVLCGRSWLDKCPALLALALYSYLRVIVDHGGPIFAQLRQREVDFCVSLMRQRVSIMRVLYLIPLLLLLSHNQVLF